MKSLANHHREHAPDAPDGGAIVAKKALGFAGNAAKLVHLRPEATREDGEGNSKKHGEKWEEESGNLFLRMCSSSDAMPISIFGKVTRFRF